MNTQTLFDNFDLLVNAPKVLLEKIRKEKEQLIAEKKIKKSEPLPPIKEDEIPYELPEGWVWARLASLGELIGGMTPSTNHSEYWDGKILWVSPKDMKVDNIIDSEMKITEKALENTRLHIIPLNSILMVARSGILKRIFPVSINRVQCTVNQDLKVLIPFKKGDESYWRLMLKGHEELILKTLVKGGMTVQSLKYEEFEIHPFPIPPENEQNRIVEKVNLLMSFCDELETKLKQAESVSENIATAVVREMVEG